MTEPEPEADRGPDPKPDGEPGPGPAPALEPLTLSLSAPGLRRALLAIVAALSGASLAVELSTYCTNRDPLEWLYPLLSLSFEQNVPTWYASALMLACGVALTLHARSAARAGQASARWWLLAVAFFYISMDEVVGVHEAASWWFDTDGWLYYGWVIPAAVIVLLFGLYQLALLRALPRRPRRQFIVAGILYVGGALVMELPLGRWTAEHGSDNLGYALIDLVEESLELLGASLFLWALVEHLERVRGSVRVRLGATRTSSSPATAR